MVDLKILRVALEATKALRCDLCKRVIGMQVPTSTLDVAAGRDDWHFHFCQGCAGTARARLKEEFGIRRSK